MKYQDPIPPCKTLLVSGSRMWGAYNVRPYLEKMVISLTHRVAHHRPKIIVGDCPHGVDTELLSLLHEHGLQATVYYADDKPRIKHIQKFGFPTVHVPYPADRYKERYTLRDEHMVHNADGVVAVWNRATRGTLHVFTYARALERKASLVTFIGDDKHIGLSQWNWSK